MKFGTELKQPFHRHTAAIKIKPICIRLPSSLTVLCSFIINCNEFYNSFVFMWLKKYKYNLNAQSKIQSYKLQPKNTYLRLIIN